MTPRPVVRVHEWTTTTLDTSGVGVLLRDVLLSDEDHTLLCELRNRTGIRITELRTGLEIRVKAHVGTVSLSRFHLVIMPKLRIDSLMRMVAYAFNLSDLQVADTRTSYATDDHGLVDLLGLALLHTAERIARGGMLPNYETRNEDLATPRGRLDIRHIATHSRGATLRCTYDELTFDHSLNQQLAAGLRLASRVMQSVDLGLDLARAADRFFGDVTRVALDADLLRGMLDSLDRRSSHYHTTLSLIALINEGARIGDHAAVGATPLSSFTLNMNLVFERFLGRYLDEKSAGDIDVFSQKGEKDVFTYLENASGWKNPNIRPDFVVRQRGKVIGVADAKYKNRFDHPPTTAELYQLAAYGLSYPMPEPREVLLLHPLATGELDRGAMVLFAPPAANQQVRIRLVGVPIDRILDGTAKGWWPWKAGAVSGQSGGGSW